MSNVYVVSSAQPRTQICSAILGYQNELSTAVSVYASSEDANYPVNLLFDYKTNTEFSPSATSGSCVVTSMLNYAKPISYVGVFSKNAEQCGLSFVVEVRDLYTNEWIEVGSRGSFADGSPQMIYFDAITSIEQRVTFYFTSKCYIANLNIGGAINFGRTPSTGYQPARNASNDEVSQFYTGGNNFIQARRIFNGNQEKAGINFLTYEFIDTFWKTFMNHVLDSKPLFFMPNSNAQNYCVFGLQNPNTLTKPSYKNSNQCDIDLEINGWSA